PQPGKLSCSGCSRYRGIRNAPCCAREFQHHSEGEGWPRLFLRTHSWILFPGKPGGSPRTCQTLTCTCNSRRLNPFSGIRVTSFVRDLASGIHERYVPGTSSAIGFWSTNHRLQRCKRPPHMEP